MLICAPQIARLMARSNRKWASRRVRAGTYGPIVRHRGKVNWVQLDHVEAAERVRFSPHQLAAAGIPIVPQEERTDGQDHDEA